MPGELRDVSFYSPQRNAQEDRIAERLRGWWKDKYK
jgi:putative ATPase